MLFTSLEYLLFFSAVFAIYWSLPSARSRLTCLLLASIWFYVSWNPWCLGLILAAGLNVYAAGLALEHTRRPGARRGLLIASIAINLGLLAFFKYGAFVAKSALALWHGLGGSSSWRAPDILLPLGISFYTFETISYVVDVYRGRTRAARDPLEFALYVVFFPRLIAGPIVRPHEFLPQLRRWHLFSWDRFQVGLQFVVIGYLKKAALADHLCPIVDQVFGNPDAYGTAAVWLGVLAYTAQIYLDFSGYSDIAIGSAHLLGYSLPRNFNLPYLARGLGEFWHRWHISLSTWLRDYLFIPLGGSRGTAWQTARNLLVTMVLGGLWHGANWTFVAWGLYHGLLLIADRFGPRGRWLPWRTMPATLLAVCVGWVFFRAQTFTTAFTLLGRMFCPTAGLGLSPLDTLTVGLVLGVLAVGHVLQASWDVRRVERRLPAPVLGTLLALLLLLTLVLIPEDGKGFIYFQF
jgi:alginate O-acetyltransferase complex protein AlgI